VPIHYSGFVVHLHVLLLTTSNVAAHAGIGPLLFTYAGRFMASVT
jgi:hypothetical protein